MRTQLQEEILSIIDDLGKMELPDTSTLLQIQSNITRVISVLEVNPGNSAEQPLKEARESLVDALEILQQDGSPQPSLLSAIENLKKAAEVI